MGKQKVRQLPLDFGERLLWMRLPEGVKQKCRELLVQVLGDIVRAEDCPEESPHD